MNALKESQDSPEDNAKEPQHDRATTLLRWLELQGLILDHARLRKTHPSDAWWVVMPEAEEVTGPYEFRGVLAALVEGAGPIQIVHDSQAALEDAPWTTLHYRPLWLNPQVLGFWRGALWALAALFAYILVTSAIPPAGHWLVNIAFVLSAGGLLARRFLVPFWSKVQPLLATKAASKRRLKKAVAVTLVTAVVAWMAWLPKEDYESLLTRGQAAWAQIASWFPGKGKAPKPTVKAAPPAAAVNEAPPMPPEPSPTVEAEPAAPEPEALNMTALASSPGLWPKTVTLRQKISFPALLNGRSIGSVDVPPGTQTRVATIRDGLLTLEYQGATQTVPPDATDLEDRVRSIRAALSAPSRPLAAIASPSPASATRAPITPGKPASAPEEVPGIPAQPANYFGTTPPPR